MEAVIFDFDGVILETSEQLFEGYKYVFSKFNIDYSEDEFNSNYGKKTKEHIKDVLKGRNISLSNEELDKLVSQRDDFYRKLCSNHLELLSGVRKLLDELKENKITMGLASSTHRKNIDFFLKKLDLAKYFKSTLGGNEITRGKPNPEIYLTICRNLNVNPENCVGIEDTNKGIFALKNANMKSIAVTLTNKVEYDFSGADLIINNLEELSLLKITKLFS